MKFFPILFFQVSQPKAQTSSSKSSKTITRLCAHYLKVLDLLNWRLTSIFITQDLEYRVQGKYHLELLFLRRKSIIDDDVVWEYPFAINNNSIKKKENVDKISHPQYLNKTTF